LYILHKKWEELIEKAYRQEFSNNLGEKSRSVKSCTHGALFNILKDVLCKLFFLPDTKLSLEELDFQACFSFGISAVSHECFLKFLDVPLRYWWSFRTFGSTQTTFLFEIFVPFPNLYCIC